MNIEEILEDVKEAKEYLAEMEKEVAYAKINRDGALTDYENALYELETANFEAFQKWKADSK